MAQIVADASSSPLEQKSVPVNNVADGRKKVRSEKQLASTAKMQKARKEKLSLSMEASPENLAVADVWYSNHELAKEKRRKAKMHEMDDLISTRLDSYHNKLMGEFQKPLANFLDSFISDNYDEDQASQKKPKLEKESRPEPDRIGTKPKPRRTESSRPVVDWSRFF